MPLNINTNIASMNAQNQLSKANDNLQISLQRLSSGLRINSALDDAAGLAIATRFTSTIQGLQQAQRNANDAISLAQVGEGALQEVSRILQRQRELSLQSANGVNTSSDRNALQAEVNQLKNELQRIATTTTYNGLNLLNGSLTNAEFQIGSESNQTVGVSIRNMQTNNLGSNQVTSNNTNGIENATYKGFIGGADLNTANFSDVAGSDIGTVNTAASNSAYTATTFTLTRSNISTGVTETFQHTSTLGDSAKTIASNLTALNSSTGVTASGFNHVTLSNYAQSDSDDTIYLLDTDGTQVQILSGTGQSYTDIATAINNSAALSTSGYYAVANGNTSVDIYNVNGEDIALENASSNGALHANSQVNTTGTQAIATAATGTLGGRVDLILDQGYSIQANNTNVLGGTANTDLTLVERIGVADGQTNNGVTAQVLTVSGTDGSTTVNVSAGQTAESIATAINAVSGNTGVTASAQTTVTLDGLTTDGLVTFTLYGDSPGAGQGSSISASVTTADISALITKINDASGATGISAEKGTSNAQIILKHSTGKDIKIENFTHSSAVDTQSTAQDNSDGTSYAVATTASLSVTGSLGGVTKLSDGGIKNGYDSTIVGGRLTFNSAEVFTISSSVDGSGQTAQSLFSVAENVGQSSTLSAVNSVNIGTAAGAQSAIDVLDQAINQVSSLRADLGAVQSRFQSAINNISVGVENLSNARSRVLDTDFAATTAELTKNQILSQAGISVLAQANSIPQAVLSLLQ